MKTAEKLTISKSTLAIVQDLADSAVNTRRVEDQLQQAISSMPDLQKAALLALTTLGRGGSHTSYTTLLKSALKQKPETIAMRLADSTRFGRCLAKGIERYAGQSER